LVECFHGFFVLVRSHILTTLDRNRYLKVRRANYLPNVFVFERQRQAKYKVIHIFGKLPNSVGLDTN
jgi:hypothetical protein